MNNTKLSAKNSFQKGLIMDFNPSDTQADCLTSALNATLLTFNGNEMALQNDMGNGRVETAYLPEGYMPVGTCEFGDIIYIVSYNPLTNKSQIGCFPSPERNLSSEELGDPLVTLSDSDFKINEELKTLSTKKILVSSKKLNPGDKFIVTSNNIDYNKNNIKLSVVSIEDGGKITYLDSEIKEYQKGAYNNGSNKVDIDAYRNLLKSGWDIFSSKVSGKLAILAELIVPETFSCTYSIDIEENGENYKYIVTLNPDLTDFINTEGIIDDNYICVKHNYKENNIITFTPNNTEGIGNNVNWIQKYNKELTLGYVDNTYKGIYNFTVSPARSFGRVDSLEIPLSINFASINSGDINLIHWKYHNTETVCTLQYGLETYLRPGEVAHSVIIEFYDHNGLAAVYKNANKKSYSGIITDYLGLDGNKVNSRLSYKHNNEIFTHRGTEFNGTKEEFENYLKSTYYLNDQDFNKLINDSKLKEHYTDETTGESGTRYYYNDAGTLYSNFLYYAKITVNITSEKAIKDAENKEPEIVRHETFGRWLWTNNMFNQYFYTYDDFIQLKCELVLDNEMLLESNKNYIWNEKVIDNLNKDIDKGKYNSYSANIQYIGMDIDQNKDQSNIDVYVNAHLENDFGCFTIPKDSLNAIQIEFVTDDCEIEYTDSSLEFSYKEVPITETTYLELKNKEYSDESVKDDNIFQYIQEENPEAINKPGQKLEDIFKATLNKTNCNLGECTYGYYDIKSGKHIRNLNTGVHIALQAVIYNKAYAEDNIPAASTMAVYSPIINSINDAENIGIYQTFKQNSIKLGLKGINLLDCFKHGDDLQGHQFALEPDLSFKNVLFGNDADIRLGDNKLIRNGKLDLKNNNTFIENIWNKINNGLGTFFSIYSIGDRDNDSVTITNDGGITPVKDSWKDNIRPILGNIWKKGDLEKNKKYSIMAIPAQDSYPDIDGNGTINVYTYVNNTYWYRQYAPVPILGVKYNEGISGLNCAYVEDNEKQTYILQEAYNKTNQNFTKYCNFASQLYLLFTRIYHKNKSEPDELVDMKNFVKNSEYVTTLTKHIVTKISSTGTDVLVRGIKLSEYKKNIKNHVDYSEIKPVIVNGTTVVDDNNVQVVYKESAKDNILTINVENKPIEFPDIEKQAQFLYNGKGYLCTEIPDNNFYIMKDYTLKKYKDEELFFTEQEISDSLKYIYGTTEDTNQYSLYGCIPKQQDNSKGDSYQYLKQKYDEWLSSVKNKISYQYDLCYLDPSSYYSLYYSIIKEKDGADYLNYSRFCSYLNDPSTFYEPYQTLRVEYIWSDNMESYINDIYKVFGKVITYAIINSGKIYLKDQYNDKRVVDVGSFSSQIQDIKNYCLQNYGYTFDQDITSFIINNIESDFYLDSYIGNPTNKNISFQTFNGYQIQNNLYINISGGKDSKISFTPKMDLNNSFKYDGELSVNTSKNHKYYGFLNDLDRTSNNNRGVFGFMQDITIDTNYQVL